MAYGNVGATPRFYIDYIQYWMMKGMLVNAGLPNSNIIDGSLFGLNPSDTTAWTGSNSTEDLNFNISEAVPINTDTMWAGVLGHNLATNGRGYSISDIDSEGSNVGASAEVEIINKPGAEEIGHDGYSIVTRTPAVTEVAGASFAMYGGAGTDINRIGSFCYGQYFEPQAPDMDVSISHRYDGVRKRKSKGGHTLTNVNYYQPPKWDELEAWQLSGFNSVLSGRRLWELNFSHTPDEDLEPRNYTGQDASGNFTQNNWLQNLMVFTMGGSLPFIFQPDTSETWDANTYSVPEFAICRFNMRTFKRTQILKDVYNIQVTIEESW